MSTMAIVTVGVQSTSIISLPGTSVSPIAPVTFLYGIIICFVEKLLEKEQRIYVV